MLYLLLYVQYEYMSIPPSCLIDRFHDGFSRNQMPSSAPHLPQGLTRHRDAVLLIMVVMSAYLTYFSLAINKTRLPAEPPWTL